jgi:hypothetical protein
MRIRKLQEIDPTSFLQVKVKARFTRKSDDVFNLTPLAILNAKMRRGFDFRLLPLDILVTRECEIENIFPPSQCDETRSKFGQHGTSKV